MTNPTSESFHLWEYTVDIIQSTPQDFGEEPSYHVADSSILLGGSRKQQKQMND